MGHYEENLTVLARRYPRLAEVVRAAEPFSGEELLPTKTGGMTLQLALAGGRKLLLASKYNPVEEARRLVDGLQFADSTTFFVLGMGMGYHLLELDRRRARGTRIVVFEADPRVMAAALASSDLTKLLSDPRVHLHAGSNFLPLASALFREVFDILRSPIQVLIHPPSKAAYPEFYTSAHTWISDFIQEGSMGVESSLALAVPTLKNRLENLPRYVANAGLDELAGRFRGVPAIVIGAGPSLHRNLDGLAAARGRAVTIGVSTALKVLLHRGLSPTFAVVSDFHSMSRRYFDRIDPELSGRVPLVANACAAHAAIDAYSGPVLFGSDEVLDRFLPGLVLPKVRLPIGTNVTFVAIQLALLFGCDPIVFVGQDLAYSYHVTHVPGTAIYNQWLGNLNRFQTLDFEEWENIVPLRGQLAKVPASDGSELYTDFQMLYYRREFERVIATANARFVNASEGGARIAGTEVLPLADALDRYASFDRSAPLANFTPPTLSAAERKRRLGTARELLRLRHREIGEWSAVLATSNDRLEKILDRLRRGEPCEKLARGFDDLMTENWARFDPFFFTVGQLAFTDTLDQIAAGHRIRTLDAADVRTREIVEANARYLAALENAIPTFRPFLERAVAAVEREFERA